MSALMISRRLLIVMVCSASATCGCRIAAWRPPLWPVASVAEQPAPVANQAITSVAGPMLEGTTLAGPPAKSATEIGLELREENAGLKETQTVLEERIEAESTENRRLTEMLARAEEQISEDRQQLQAARNDLETWQQELASVYQQIQEREERRGRELAELANLVAETLAEFESEADADEEPPSAAPPPTPSVPKGPELSAVP